MKMFESTRMQPNLRPLKQDVIGDIGSVLWILMGTLGIVLVIACADVANLLLSAPKAACTSSPFAPLLEVVGRVSPVNC